MPEREPGAPERLLERHAHVPGLDVDQRRGRVDRADARHALEIDDEGVRSREDAAADAAPGAEGNERHALARRPAD